MSANTGRNLLVVAAAIVVATLVAALWVMESPSKQRDRRLDERRTEQLQAIASALDAWFARDGSLPASLAELARQPGLSLPIVDPVDGAAYDYRPGSGRGYRLCARFATNTADRDAGGARFGWQRQDWLHPAGPHCFERSVPKAPDDAAAGAARDP